MKICLICGESNANDAKACVKCGEGSWSIAVPESMPASAVSSVEAEPALEPEIARDPLPAATSYSYRSKGKRR